MSNLDRLVDDILELGIKPDFNVSSHRLPEALEDKGSWANRDVLYWAADFLRVLAQKLGDRVQDWTGMLDPEALLPAKAKEAWASKHHRVLFLPFAKEAMLSERNDLRLGFGLKFLPIFPASDRNRDHEAVLQILAETQDYYLSLLYQGRFSEAALSYAKYACQSDLDFLREADKHKIKGSADFLRLDYEFLGLIDVKDPESFTRKGKLARRETHKGEPYDHRRSSERLYEALKRLLSQYEIKDLRLSSSPYLPVKETEYEQGIEDRERSLYHSYHLQALLEFGGEESPIHSYLFPAIFDNAAEKAGLIHMSDDDELTLKDSGYWFRAMSDTRNPYWEASVNYKEIEG